MRAKFIVKFLFGLALGSALFWFYQGCSRNTPSNAPLSFYQYYPVSPSSTEISEYVPSSENQLADAQYVSHISALIDSKVAQVSSSSNLLKLIKAIAWQESRWAHYVSREGKYFVIMGDNGHAFGIMQINDIYHPQKTNLSENLEYAISLIKSHYDRALGTDCPSGTNRGKTLNKIVRRTYAQYNGGNNDMCRDDDDKDDEVESHFSSQPWLHL